MSKAMHKKKQNMMQDKSLSIDIATSNQYEPKYLQAQMVTAVILALGSNHRAAAYLSRVREKLATLGKLECSAAFENLDFTATKEQPKPNYTNQCVYLELDSGISLQQLQQLFKSFEGECHRVRESASILPALSEGSLAQTELSQVVLPPSAWRQVTMDIDILLIKSEDNESNDSCWIIMADRYPFKAHENAGITALIAKDVLF